MKSYQLFCLIAILTINVAAEYTNTTSFWQTMINDNDIHFQVYSGIFFIYLQGYEEIDWYHPKDTSGMYYNLFSAMGHKLGNN